MLERARRVVVVDWVLVMVLVVAGSGCDEAKKLVAGEQQAPAVEQGKEQLYALYRKQVSSVGQLDDAMVERYIKAYEALRKVGVNLPQELAKPGAAAKWARGGNSKLEGAVKAGGFSNLADFVKVNAKIAWAFIMAQGQLGLSQQDKLQKWSQRQLSAGQKQILDALKDPQTPESTKRELRKTLAKLQAGQRESAATYAKNRKWAGVAIKWIGPLTNSHDVEVIKRHEAELRAIFMGLNSSQLEAVKQATLKQLELLNK